MGMGGSGIGWPGAVSAAGVDLDDVVLERLPLSGVDAPGSVAAGC